MEYNIQKTQKSKEEILEKFKLYQSSCPVLFQFIFCLKQSGQLKLTFAGHRNARKLFVQIVSLSTYDHGYQ